MVSSGATGARAYNNNNDDDEPTTNKQAAHAFRFNKRDVSLAEKYIELALVLSQDMFDKRNSSTRLEVLHDAIQIINCLDLYFRSANTRVAIVYIETWAHGDQIELSTDVKQTLYNFLDYTSRKLYKISMDATHLLTGGHAIKFDANKLGISIPGSICTSRAVSVSQEASVFEPFIAASAMAHMLGHNLGMEHDEPTTVSTGQAAPSAPSTTHHSPTDGSTRSSGSSLLSHGIQQYPPARFAPVFQRPGAAAKTPPGPASSSNELHEEHDDEIKSRSVSQRSEPAPSEHCQSNCLMSERFVYLEPPVSFGNIVKHQTANGSSGTNNNQITLSNGGAETQNTLSMHEIAPPMSPPASISSATSGSTLPATYHVTDQLNGPTMDQIDLELQNEQIIRATLPFRFSKQSIEAYNKILRSGRGICLFNKPNRLEDFKNCGNGIVDDGEECDCGKLQECLENDSCCDPRTCRFKIDAQCTSGACCDRCRFRPKGFVCRKSRGECDLPEYCSGATNQCPPDVHKQNGFSCSSGQGYCFLGQCPLHDAQCAELWGSDARNSDRLCYSSFNVNGTRRGNCGIVYDTNPPKFKRCEHQNMMCGTLQCQLGNMEPVTAGIGSGANEPTGSSRGAVGSQFPANTETGKQQQQRLTSHEYSNKTLYASDGRSHNCKVIVGVSAGPNGGDKSGTNAATSSISYVRDGSKCGTNKVCFNKTCQPIDMVYREAFELCPRDELGRFCSGNGVCSTANRCHCHEGWAGQDCSQPWQDEAPLSVTSSSGSSSASHHTLLDITSQPSVDSPLVPINQHQRLNQNLDQLNQFLAPEAPSRTNSMSLEQANSGAPAPSLAGALPTATSAAEIAITMVPAVPLTTPPPADPVGALAPATPTPSSNIQVQDKKKHDALGAPTLVFILVSIVAAVYVGFALMANCYRRKGFIKPDKVLRHHQMNCKLDALRSSFIAKRLAEAAAATHFDNPNQAASSAQPCVGPLLASNQNGPNGVDLVSPFVSPLSGQGPCQHLSGTIYGQSGEPNDIQLGFAPTAQDGDQLVARSYLGPQPYTGPTQQATGLKTVGSQQQQQQQQQVQAAVHYYDQDDSRECLHGGAAPYQQSTVDAFGCPEAGSGDHIPLLLGHDRQAKRRPQANQVICPTGPQTFGGRGRLLPARNLIYQDDARCMNTMQIQQVDRVGLSYARDLSVHMNRAISLGNVNNHKRLSGSDLGDELDEGDKHATAAHRALATPSRINLAQGQELVGGPMRGRTGSSGHSLSNRNRTNVELDSCSAPSSPEHRDPYWSDADACKRSIGLSRPVSRLDGGYHEDVILGTLPQIDGRQQRRSIGSAGPPTGTKRDGQPLRQQRSIDQMRSSGNENDEQDPSTLPPPPPPGHHLLGEGADGNDTEDESELAQMERLRGKRISDSLAKQLALGAQRASGAARRQLGPNSSDSSNINDHLSLIAQLKQLEQVQSLHQKQLASEKKLASGGEVGLHEFFSLPLSVQLSALLARSLTEQSTNQRDFNQMTPIDDFLNTLNNTNVANSSRKSFRGSSGQLIKGEQQQYQSSNSRGGTMRRQQMKLQNLQGLITRLQKLHNQTVLQQQLEDLNGEFDQEDLTHDFGSSSRQSSLGRTSVGAILPLVSRANQTNDDLYEIKNRQLDRKSRRSNIRRLQTSKSIARDETTAVGVDKNEPVYSMSDSEDGAYVSRMLTSYGHNKNSQQNTANAQVKAQEANKQATDNLNNPNDDRQVAESTSSTISTEVSSTVGHQQQLAPPSPSPSPSPPPPPPPPPPEDED